MADFDFPTQKTVDDYLGDRGYVVVEGIFSPEELSRLKTSITDQVLWQNFGRKGIDIPDEKVDEYLRALVDKPLRERLIDKEIANDTVWRNGNSRAPRHNKTTGMNHVEFNPDVMELIHFNRKVYRELRAAYNYPYLAHTCGPERVSIKPKGSTKMDKHIDRRLEWHDQSDVNYPVRAQAMVCIDIDMKGPLNKTGTLTVLSGFHLYWDFASALFHPKDGLVPFPDFGTRFFKLPPKFDTYFLPELRKYAIKYRDFLRGSSLNLDPETLSAFNEWKSRGITIRDDLPPIEWKHIDLRPGDLVIWSQSNPHYSESNTSNTPRITAYLSLMPVIPGKDGRFSSKEADWVRKQYATLSHFYGVNNGVYPTNPLNIEEKEYIKEFGLEKRIREILADPGSDSGPDEWKHQLRGEVEY